MADKKDEQEEIRCSLTIENVKLPEDSLSENDDE